MKILIVDADPGTRDALAVGLQLQWQDCAVLTAADGEAGERAFFEHAPDVVLLDPDLPGGAGVAVLLGLVLGVPLVVFGIVAGVALGIVVTYALRAIADEDTGPLAALGSGWRLLRRHPGESLLVWLISLALGAGAVVVVGLAVGVLVVPLVLLGVGIWNLAGTGATVGYGVLAGLLVLAIVAGVGAVLNTFFWSYWSLAYVRLSRGL